MGQRCRGWIWCPWGVVYEARGSADTQTKVSAPLGSYRPEEGVWSILGEQLGVTQGISARLCDKVIVSFYYFFALQKKNNFFFFFFSIFLIMKVFVSLLDTDTLEYFWLNTSFILWMRDGKIKRFFLSNFQPIHVLLQRLVQWQVENLSSCQVASFCRSIHKRQEKEHSEG